MIPSKIKEYEIIFIYPFNQTLFDEALKKTKSFFKEHEVRIKDEKDLGTRKLAYPVKKHKEAHYYLFVMNIHGDKIREMEREFNLYDHILKYMFTRIEKSKPRKFKKIQFKEKTYNNPLNQPNFLNNSASNTTVKSS